MKKIVITIVLLFVFSISTFGEDHSGSDELSITVASLVKAGQYYEYLPVITGDSDASGSEDLFFKYCNPCEIIPFGESKPNMQQVSGQSSLRNIVS